MEVKLYKEPLTIIEQLSENKSEMSEWQLALLCGMIQQYKPSKIVEVGVAAGGTTAVILNCINLLGLETKLYSIDISENYYYDKSKKTGYMAEEYKFSVGGA